MICFLDLALNGQDHLVNVARGEALDVEPVAAKTKNCLGRSMSKLNLQGTTSKSI